MAIASTVTYGNGHSTDGKPLAGPPNMWVIAKALETQREAIKALEETVKEQKQTILDLERSLEHTNEYVFHGRCS